MLATFNFLLVLVMAEEAAAAANSVAVVRSEELGRTLGFLAFVVDDLEEAVQTLW